MNKREDLIGFLKKISPVAVAYSGGVDSGVVAAAAKKADARSIAVLVCDASVASGELNNAKKVAREIGIELVVVADEKKESDENYIRNDAMRCYFCKKGTYDLVAKAARGRGMRAIVDGNNIDDALADERPGMGARREYGVVSPLLELKFTKNDVREIAKEFGLSNWDRPAAPCLASRVKRGIPISNEILSRVELAEDFVREAANVSVLRVRHIGESARVEVGNGEMAGVTPKIKQKIKTKLHSLGYSSIEFAEYRRGGA